MSAMFCWYMVPKRSQSCTVAAQEEVRLGYSLAAVQYVFQSGNLLRSMITIIFYSVKEDRDREAIVQRPVCEMRAKSCTFHKPTPNTEATASPATVPTCSMPHFLDVRIFFANTSHYVSGCCGPVWAWQSISEL
jgi:hypothetical protein